MASQLFSSVGNVLGKVNTSAILDQAVATFLADSITPQFSGIEYERNSHKNYLIATIQNPYIKTIFFNSYLQIVVNVCDVNLGDIIDIVIPDSTSQNLNGAKSVDVVNSGKYLVGGIMQDIRKDGYYSMVLTLFRNGVNDSNFDGKLFEMLKV